MQPFSYIHNASLEQLLRWWERSQSLPDDFEVGGFDEVAYALTKYPEGIAVLRTFLKAGDRERRSAALRFLAWPGIADEEVRTELIRAFWTADPEFRCIALWGFIHLGFFPLKRADLQPLLDGTDQQMAARAMLYLSRACPEDSVAILRDALRSTNPRMRDYACDEIGDREIEELKEEMRLLINDTDPDVSQTARLNLW
jgi:hypothetical protein